VAVRHGKFQGTPWSELLSLFNSQHDCAMPGIPFASTKEGVVGSKYGDAFMFRGTAHQNRDPFRKMSFVQLANQPP
jgi:hypothetical protein